MDDKEIVALVEKKILQAKLDVADKRFNTLVILAGVFLSVFTIIVPIWQMSKSADEVDKALLKADQVIQKMEDNSSKTNEVLNSMVTEYSKVSEKLNEKGINISKDIDLKFDKASDDNQKELAGFSDRIEKRIESALGEATKTTKLKIMYGQDSLNGKIIEMNLKEGSSFDLQKINFLNAGDKVIRKGRYIISFTKVVDKYAGDPVEFVPAKGYVKSFSSPFLLELMRGIPDYSEFSDVGFVMHNDQTEVECQLIVFYEDYFEEVAIFTLKHKE